MNICVVSAPDRPQDLYAKDLIPGNFYKVERVGSSISNMDRLPDFVETTSVGEIEGAVVLCTGRNNVIEIVSITIFPLGDFKATSKRIHMCDKCVSFIPVKSGEEIRIRV